jgi:hypothetical protein
MRIHPPHQQLAEFMSAAGIEGLAEVQERPDDALVAAWLAARCLIDSRWC